MTDLGVGGRGGGPLFWTKKEEMTEGKKASSESKSRPETCFSLGLDLASGRVFLAGKAELIFLTFF